MCESLDSTDGKQIREILASIRTKIENCDSLATVLKCVENKQPIPQELDDSTEIEIIQLYIDLLDICNQKHII